MQFVQSNWWRGSWRMGKWMITQRWVSRDLRDQLQKSQRQLSLLVLARVIVCKPFIQKFVRATVPKNDRGKASNKEIDIFPTCWSRSFHTIWAASGSQSTSFRDVQAKRTIKPYLRNILSCQQWASIAIAIKMGIRCLWFDYVLYLRYECCSDIFFYFTFVILKLFLPHGFLISATWFRICTTALSLWDEVVGSTTAAEVGDGDEVMQPITTNAAIGWKMTPYSYHFISLAQLMLLK